jgi:hypothetical protein
MMMTRGRRSLLSALFLFLIGGQAFDVGFKREDWPFSSYPMYSNVHLPIVVIEDLFGFGAAGEFELAARRHFAPLDNARFQRGLKQVVRANDGGARYDAMIETLFRRYESLREAGAHDDPPLLGVRSYRSEWDIESGAVNRHTPDRRTLRFYVHRPSAALRDRLAREAGSDLSAAERDARRHVATTDAVVDAAKLLLDGGAERISDRNAASGAALRLDAEHPRDSDTGPAATATATIPLARGRYSLWLRGKTSGPADPSSLDVAVVAGAELHCWPSIVGMGNWQEAFPAGAYAWSSSAPGAPPCTLEVTGKPVTLRISAHTGHVMLDQLWLAAAQIEQPDFAEAVVVEPIDAPKASQ